MYDLFEKTLSNSSYLKEITEDVIYEAYQGVIKKNHTREFTDFSQNNRNAYIRLKLRDLTYSNSKSQP